MAMAGIEPQPGIMEIELYVGGAGHVDGVANVVKLSSNENPYGPSEAAVEAYRRAAFELHRYPSTDHAGLRTAIGEVHGLDPDRILCGAGSDEVLQFVTQAYAGPGDEVIYTEHGFSMYPILAHAAGAVPVKVAERERVVDVDAILAAVTPRTRIVFIANPANPTGTMISEAETLRLARALPGNVVLVLDGAYAEFVDGFDGGASVVDACANVVMTRTFSKIHGLGGLRIGWGYAQRPVIDVLNRLRQPFNLSNGQLAAAEAAIRDTAYAEKCRTENARLRQWLAEALAERGVPSDVSMTNFILARFASRAEAEACDEYLKARGLIVRRVAGYGLPHCLRITIGDEPSCRQVAHAVGRFKAGEA
jgi:histidinol-phosphate aminotransferase